MKFINHLSLIIFVKYIFKIILLNAVFVALTSVLRKYSFFTTGADWILAG
ncbi:MAG: hypothetical protein LBU09_02150 [Endomicrobium sp.]|nr:hypothetical protein [Endomicrobium sp.]